MVFLNFFVNWLRFVLFLVLIVEPKFSNMLGKYSTIESGWEPIVTSTVLSMFCVV